MCNMYAPIIKKDKSDVLKEENKQQLFKLMRDADKQRADLMSNKTELGKTIKRYQERLGHVSEDLVRVECFGNGIRKVIQTLGLMDEYEEWGEE